MFLTFFVFNPRDLYYRGYFIIITITHLHNTKQSEDTKDCRKKFPGLPITKAVFQDFSGPGNLTKKTPVLLRTFQEAREPCIIRTLLTLLTDTVKMALSVT